MSQLDQIFDEMLAQQNTPELGGSSRLYGIYRGYVVGPSEGGDAHVDEKHMGRLRVRLVNDPLYDLSEPTNFYEAEYSAGFGGGPNAGMFANPYKDGDAVWLMFEQGRPEFPVITGLRYSAPEEKKENSTVPSEVNNDEYPKRWIWKMPNGHSISISDEPTNQEVTIKTASGHIFHMRETPQDKTGVKGYGGTDPWMGEKPDSTQGIYIQTSKGHKIEMVDEHMDGNIDGIRIEDRKGNFIQMDDDKNLLTLYWKGDCTYEVTGNVTGKIGGWWNKSIGAWTKMDSPLWTWMGNLHKRIGKTFDQGRNDHG